MARKRPPLTGNLRQWSRLYQTPLWLTAVFIGLLTLFAVTPDPTRPAANADPDPTSEPTPGPGECFVCGIDQECDPSSGRCVFIKATPVPCVQGARFDEKAGFCLPTGAPTPVPVPTVLEPEEEEEGPFVREPSRGREPRRFDDDSRFEDRPTAEPTEEPEETPEDDETGSNP